MKRFALQRFAHLALYVTLAYGASACGADTDHGPTIGAPEGPIGPVLEEVGGASASSGGRPGADPNGGAATIGTGGTSAFGVAGNGSANDDPFGSGGFAADSVPFGSSGTFSF